jgi:hypothetical protein
VTDTTEVLSEAIIDRRQRPPPFGQSRDRCQRRGTPPDAVTSAAIDPRQSLELIPGARPSRIPAILPSHRGGRIVTADAISAYRTVKVLAGTRPARSIVKGRPATSARSAAMSVSGDR